MKADEESPVCIKESKPDEQTDPFLLFIHFLLQPPILLVFLTSFFYICGYIFYESSLLQWGLDASLFPLSIDMVLLHAFTPTIIIALKILAGAVLIVFIGWLILLVVGYLFQKWGLGRKEKTEEWSSWKKIAYFIAIISPFCLIFIFSICMFVLYAVQGQKSAQNFKAAFDREESPGVNIVLRKNEDILNGYSITCSERHCAFYINHKVVVLPLSDIKKIISTPRE